MPGHSPSPHVLANYPDAVGAGRLTHAFLWYVRQTLGLAETQVASLASICSDDLNSVEFPKTGMVGPFYLGGLDGYPFVGRTGLEAFAHHVPERGAAVLFCGPHVGVSDQGHVGRVVRPGQSHESDCCGAAMAALRKLQAGLIEQKSPEQFDPDDYQQEMIEQLVLAHQHEILGATSSSEADQFKRMTEAIYLEMRRTMVRLLKIVEFRRPAFVVGGILINEDHGRPSSISLRDAYYLQGKQTRDVKQDFLESVDESLRTTYDPNHDSL